MRGIAAIAVLLQHGLTTKLEMGADKLASFFTYFGPTGVDIFFVISGFIIAKTAASDASADRRAAADFAIRRVIRIYPLYWIVLSLSILASFWIPMSAPSMPMASATSLVTLTTTANWFVPPAWTLAFEIYFYAGVVVILIIAPRFLFLAILLWMLVEASLGNLLPSWVHTHALVIEFGFGCLIAYLVNCRIRIAPMVSFLAASTAFFAGVVLSVQFGQIGGWLRVSTFGLGSAFLINAVIAAEQSGFIFPHVMQYLGNASYSVYIWHWLLLRALIGMSERTGLIELVSPSSRPVFLVLWIAAALALALAAHEYLERPILQFLKRLRFHPRRLFIMSTEQSDTGEDGKYTIEARHLKTSLDHPSSRLDLELTPNTSTKIK